MNSNLCPDCAAIDLSVPPDPQEIQVLRDIGSGSSLSPSGTCGLCDIMLWMLDAKPNGVARDGLCLVRRETGQGYHQPDFQKGYMMVEKPSSQVYHWGRAYDSISDTPRSAVFAEKTNNETRNQYLVYCLPSTILPDRLDYHIIGSWMQHCRKNHESCRPSDPPKLPIRVIDCAANRVVYAPKNCDYTTLSYVWGKAPDNSHVSDDGILVNVPATIGDAMTVTLSFGYRYIWIDRYCIDQNNLAEKLAQIQQMGAIYQGSVLTIFAACGDGPHHGLPGVGKTPRQEQIRRMVHGREMVGLLDVPRKTIEDSVWMSRGWTFQEGMLSKRRLFFTDQQIYFECRHNMVRDELFGPGQPIYPGDSGLELRMAPGAPNRALFTDPCVEYLYTGEAFEYISEYSKRQLTFEGDRLNAILGILKVLEEHKYPIFHLQGVPIITSTPEPRNCWGPRKARPKWTMSAAFMLGMSWNMKTQVPRNPAFPSWSWISWAGEIGWGQKCFASPVLEGLTDRSDLFKGSVWMEIEGGRDEALEAYEGRGEALGLTFPLSILVESETYAVTLEHFDRPSEGFYTFGDEHGRHSRDSSRPCSLPAGHWASWKTNSGIASYVSVNVFNEYTAKAQNITYKVLVLSYESPSSSFVEGKLLHRTGDNYEVAGYASLSGLTIYFQTAPDNTADVSQVGLQMIMPEMKRERVRIK